MTAVQASIVIILSVTECQEMTIKVCFHATVIVAVRRQCQNLATSRLTLVVFDCACFRDTVTVTIAITLKI